MSSDPQRSELVLPANSWLKQANLGFFEPADGERSKTLNLLANSKNSLGNIGSNEPTIENALIDNFVSR